MKYSVDKIENDIVLLEDIVNGNKVYANLKEFNFKVKESDIVFFDNKTYKLDLIEKNYRIDRIKAKMERLKNKGNDLN